METPASKQKLSLPVTLAFAILFAGCGAEYHAHGAQAGLGGDQLTLGTVQKDIRNGMNATEVLETLGSPNIVTRGDNGTETWVYDRIGTDSVHSESGGWWFLVLAGGSTGSGAASTSQRTLTVIIKFDEQKKVRDLAYNSSRF